MSTAPDASADLRVGFRLDLVRTLAPLAHGRGDPTIRLGAGEAWRACRTPDGAATLRVTLDADSLHLQAWGPGAQWVVASGPGLIGLHDEPDRLQSRHRLIEELARRFAGLRLPATLLPFDALLPAICEQKVTGDEARRAYRAIVRTHGEPAPGPGALWLAPEPGVLARLPYFAFHRLGLERRRAEVVIRAAAVARDLAGRPQAEAQPRLAAVAGIGPWTLAEVARVTWGDPDALSVGDYHVPNLVAWALAGEPRADDTRMLELLEPYRGQRGRVQRLLEVSGISPPRYGPRMASRRIATI